MPCYDPGDDPGPFEAGEAKDRETRFWAALGEKDGLITRYTATLTEIEEYCKEMLKPNPAMSQAMHDGERFVAQQIQSIIDKHWG